MTYFECLPRDLIHSLFLYFSSDELIDFIEQSPSLELMFNIKNSKIFWSQIWKRDLSSFIIPPETNMYNEYRSLLICINGYEHSEPSKLNFLAGRGLDVLLLPYLRHVNPDYFSAICHTASKGYCELTEKLVKLAPQLINTAMGSAAGGGHLDTVLRMIELGANDYGGAMVFAAIGGKMDMVKFMLDKGATNYNNALLGAKVTKHEDIVILMRGLGAIG